MNVVKAYFRLNLKMLLNDKVSFIWSIVFPIGFILSGMYTISSSKHVVGYYSYVIFLAYVIQIALDSLYLKNSGYLRVYFSIKETKLEFFMAQLLSQIIYAGISITVINIVVGIYSGLSFAELMKYGVVMIITCIPVAFLFFSITMIKGVSFKTLSTIMNIMLAFFAMMAPQVFDNPINYINPLVYMTYIVWIDSAKGVFIYMVVAIVSVLVGVYSISKYSAKSDEVR